MTNNPTQFQPRTDTKPRPCVKCGKTLAKHLRYYCSGECMKLAKEDGTYGNEPAI